MTPSVRAAPLLALLLTGCLDTGAGMQDLRDYIATVKTTAPGKKLDPLPTVEPYRPYRYSAQGLKDPFALAAFVQPVEPELPDNGIRPDPERPREELERYALGSLKMVGTVQRDGLWALIKAPDGIIHRITVGNYLGNDYGRVTAISERRIDLVEIVSEDGQRWDERDNFLSLTE